MGYFLENPHTLLINEKMDQAVIKYISIDATGAGVPKSALYVPLMCCSVIGEIVLMDMQKEHAFSQSDVRLLETLANSLSVALENARLWEQEKLYLTAMEHEFKVGREIQAGFLPRTLPQPKGWEIAATLKPAREVAGDFYDVFVLPGGKIGLVIADVCDKGLGAALFMTLFRSFIRSVSNIDFCACVSSEFGEISGERIMQAISLTNKYIVETHGDTGMFATLFFGIFAKHAGLLTYINGGHLPPRLSNKNGIKHVLTLTGPAIGGRADAEFVLRDVMIEPGDTLFAYTDGLTDAENIAGETLSEKSLIPLFSLDRPLPPILTQIHKQIESFSAGTRQIDDITMLAVRRGKK
jgi:sigma-B regulation protein RsbU (phosphoserine phosphatase)